MGSILRATQGEDHPEVAIKDGAGDEKKGWRYREERGGSDLCHSRVIRNQQNLYP